MPASQYILAPIENSGSDLHQVSPEQWDSWWDGKRPRFEYDDIILDKMICALTPPGGKVLEAGCGLGRWVNLLRKKGFCCSGVESSAVAYSAACKLYPESKFVRCDITKLEHIPSNTLDTYLSWGVFEHFRDGPAVPLREALRVLKPGGVMLATIPNYSIFRRLVRPYTKARNYLKSFSLLQKMVGKKRSNVVWFEYQYTPVEFTDCLTSVGFLPLSVIPIFHRHGIHMASRILRKSNTEMKLNFLGDILEQWSKRHSPNLFAHMNLFVAVKPMENLCSQSCDELNQLSLQ